MEAAAGTKLGQANYGNVKISLYFPGSGSPALAAGFLLCQIQGTNAYLLVCISTLNGSHNTLQ